MRHARPSTSREKHPPFPWQRAFLPEEMPRSKYITGDKPRDLNTCRITSVSCFFSCLSDIGGKNARNKPHRPLSSRLRQFFYVFIRIIHTIYLSRPMFKRERISTRETAAEKVEETSASLHASNIKMKYRSKGNRAPRVRPERKVGKKKNLPTPPPPSNQR